MTSVPWTKNLQPPKPHSRRMEFRTVEGTNMVPGTVQIVDRMCNYQPPPLELRLSLPYIRSI